MSSPVLAEEGANRLLRLEVEAERRLVEKEHLGLMQQRGRELALHALAERELPRGLVDEFTEHEQVDELRAPRRVIGGRHTIDGAIEPEGLLGRQIPEQLLLVAEHERDALAERVAAGPRIAPGHLRAARAGEEQPGEHLERRRLSGAVGAEKGNGVAALDRERDIVHGANLSIARTRERGERAPDSGVAHLHIVRLAQPGRDDGRRHSGKMCGPASRRLRLVLPGECTRSINVVVIAEQPNDRPQ